MENRNELAGRVEILENAVEYLKEEILKIKSAIRNLSEELKSSMEDSIEVEAPSLWDAKESQLRANVWTEDATQYVFRAIETLPSEFPKETFKPTVSALREKEEGATASDVGEITGRREDIESFCLKRLYIAGIVKRRLRGRRVLYKITDNKKITEKYSYLFN